MFVGSLYPCSICSYERQAYMSTVQILLVLLAIAGAGLTWIVRGIARDWELKTKIATRRRPLR